MTRALLVVCCTAAMSAFTPPAISNTQSIPAAVTSDNTRDATFPAKLDMVRFDSHGSMIPARVFRAAGAGFHPTVLMLHGFPGVELNLDLARAIQRADWNAVVITYRGVWGTPGQYSVSHQIEDTRAALAWLRDPKTVTDLGIDISKIVVLGHSAGGFDTVMVGDDRAIAGFVIISAADLIGMRRLADTPAKLEAYGVSESLSYTNMTMEAFLAENSANTKEWDWTRNAAQMAGRPLLTISSDDGFEPADIAAANAVEAAGGPTPKRVKFADDHSYNNHRIALQAAVVSWLESTFKR